MYNIKQAASRAGVTVPVLRAWERRYGIVHPARSSGGYRLFDDDSVARVRAMRILVDEGWSPSTAASAILAGEINVPASADAVPARRGLPIDAPASLIPADDAAAVIERFMAAARAVDPGAMSSVLDDLFSRGSFERVTADIMFPALIQLGEAWASGDMSVAGEHMAASAAQRRLGMGLEAAAAAVGTGPRMLVGMPSGARHELGALAFAVAASRAGIQVTYVGADLPIDAWLAAAQDVGAAVIGAITPRDRPAALGVARGLRAKYPNLVVAIGGRSAPPSSEFLRLTGSLAESVAAVRKALDATFGATA